MFTCGLKESTETKIELCHVPAAVFKAILAYIYTNEFEVKDVPLASLTEYLAAAHLYGLDALVEGIARNLPDCMSVENVLHLYQVADLYKLRDVNAKCLRFMDNTAALVLKRDGLLELSKVLNSLSMDFEIIVYFASLDQEMLHYPVLHRTFENISVANR
jgi:hypothetical protein